MSDAMTGKIRDLVAEQLGVDVGTLSSDANILEDLGADSLDVVELVMAIEEEFDIEIPDEEAEKIQTIADATNYLKAQLDG